MNRQQAIELAMTHYWVEGVQSLSLNELCRRAQISKPSLYREFGGADGLMEAALVHYRVLVLQPLLDVLAQGLPFEAVVDGLVQEFTKEGPYPAGCLFTEMRMARTHLGPATRTRLIAVEQERLDALTEWLNRVCESRAAQLAMSPEQAARYMDSQMSLALLQLGSGVSRLHVREQMTVALYALRREPQHEE